MIVRFTNGQTQTRPIKGRPHGLHALNEAQVFKPSLERTSSFHELISLSSLPRSSTLQVQPTLSDQASSKKTVVPGHRWRRHLLLQQTHTSKPKTPNTNPPFLFGQGFQIRPHLILNLFQTPGSTLN